MKILFVKGQRTGVPGAKSCTSTSGPVGLYGLFTKPFFPGITIPVGKGMVVGGGVGVVAGVLASGVGVSVFTVSVFVTGLEEGVGVAEGMGVGEGRSPCSSSLWRPEQATNNKQIVTERSPK